MGTRVSINNRKSKHIIIKISFLVILFITMLTSLTGFAPSAHAIAPAEAKLIKVGYFDAGRMMMGATGKPNTRKGGYAYEFLQELAVHTGWRYQYVTGSFEEIFAKLLSGEVDIVPMLSRTEERIGKIGFPDQPFGMEYFFLATIKERIGEFRDPVKGLEGKKIGVDAGYAENQLLIQFLEENHINAELVPYDTSTQKSLALRKMEVDATLNSNNAVPQDLMLIQNIGSMPCYIGVSLHRPDLLKEMNAAVRAIDVSRPGFTSYLTERYFLNTPLNRQLAADESAWVNNHATIRFGGYAESYPYTYSDENGNITGVTVEGIRLMFERLNLSCRPEWKLYKNRQELHEALRHGQIDIIVNEYYDLADADENDVILSDITNTTVMGMLCKGQPNEHSMDNVATLEARLGPSYMRDNYPSSKVVTCKTINECIEKLYSGEATAVVANVATLKEYARKAASSDTFQIIPLSAQCNVCFAARRNENFLVRLMNRGIHFVPQSETEALTLQFTLGRQETLSATDFFRLHWEYPVIFLVLLASLTIVAYALQHSNKSERKLALANAQITEANERLEAVVAERTQALADALADAESASKSKTTFLFNMSHDIRTPMNAILGFNKMAEKNLDDKEKLLDCLGKVESAGKHLLGLINDVLEMARIENGKLELDEKIVNLLDQKNKTTAMVDSLANEKKITFTKQYINIDTDSFLWLDTTRIDQVLLNVLSNAIKYTPAGGTVNYTLEQLPGDDAEHVKLRFTVKDNGIGMSQEFVDKIFENFSRERSSTVSGIQGTGLGMAIVKRIVDLLGGTITVNSKLGAGTTICIELHPRIATAEAASAEPEHVQKAVTLSGLKVLLVEDNDLNREIACEMLKEFEMEIDEAEDGTVAVDKLSKAEPGQYDIVLMDIQMPIMDGYRATQEIRRLPNKAIANIPIIAMTANAFAEDKKRAIESGMNDHIAKPVDVAKLIEAMAKHVKTDT